MSSQSSINLDLVPKPIVALDESVVNRIAAGEIIVRPANAVKELLENSIDAGSTSVKITVKEGGVKMLQIQDNGCGIRKADLGILCERFTTSKIGKFDDLASLRTYGFRGEALASISHVAHLTIATKTRDEGVGWKARYLDGKLKPLKPGGSPDPQPCAGNDGTMITIEDMFYNIPQRRKALHTASEEYRKILDIVTKYAIHNRGVAISCKKVGSTLSDVNTSASSTAFETIGRLYSETLKKELMHLDFKDKKLDYHVDAYFSSPNYNAKKPITMIFINNRLVDCSPLRKSLEITYAAIIPKGNYAFIYISIQIPPERVDPNVHPNKNEVHFLDQDEIIDKICDKLNVFLSGANSTRTYHVQTLLPITLTNKGEQSFNSSQPEMTQIKPNKNTKAAPQKLVRTDPQTQTLQSFIRSGFNTMIEENGDTPNSDSSLIEEAGLDIPNSGSKEVNNQIGSTSAAAKIEESQCLLQSVQDLRREIQNKNDVELENFIKNHTFVGVVDIQKGYSCIQHATEFHLVHHTVICEELFYQLGVRQFGTFDRIQLKPPPSVHTLVTLAVESEPNKYLDQFGRPKAVKKICERLQTKAEMLDEYFSLSIDQDGHLQTLPMILPDYVPNMEKLPLFLVRVAVECDWTDELTCFSNVLREVAFFYAPGGLPSDLEESGNSEDDFDKEQLQQILFPAMKRYLKPPSDIKHSIKLVTSLPALYKVFERC
ncbi:hypothetical protein O181_045149 [Austropuccinia psidii MF-1]|uniref:DNA mismatch repair protein S5 domain-containing protein n=1 Tax=Austropuccinia psidii MF-1 TaxID=1389203 RepID=A0A9Q3HK39_9BASI|nr:hypothetical protein [Austropuccinia psidii MF-1]